MLLFFKDWDFFLCAALARGRLACFFHLPRAGQCDRSESSSSLILRSSSWIVSRAGSEAEKQLLGKEFSANKI